MQEVVYMSITYQCKCAHNTFKLVGKPNGEVWLVCAKCSSMIGIGDAIGVAARSKDSNWKARKAEMSATKRRMKHDYGVKWEPTDPPEPEDIA